MDMFTYRHQSAGKNHNKTADKSYENVTEYKYPETTIKSKKLHSRKN
jgi:hypothetical protein